MTPPPDTNLLAGALAVRYGFLTPENLAAALGAWLRDRSKPLLAVFVDGGWLTPDRAGELAGLLGLNVPTPPTNESGRETTTWSPSDTAPPARSEAPPPRYLPVSFHRRGGVGEVHRARDLELNRQVALKHLQARYADNPNQRDRLVREAEITGRLEHPGIVPVYGLCHGPAGPFYVMRFIEGDSLQDAVERFHAADGPDREPAERAVAFRDLLTRFVAVCQTIAYSHDRGVIHRDLKSANVMLGPYGETLVVDWGLAARKGDAPPAPPDPRETALANPYRVSSPGFGTPAYMAPEQHERRADEIDALTDVYCLGAILFEILTGTPPHVPDRVTGELSARERKRGLPGATTAPPVPDALDRIAARALHPDRDHRHPSPADLAREVSRWLADEPVEGFKALLAKLAARIEADPTRELREERARTLTNIGLMYLGMARPGDAERVLQEAILAYDALLVHWPAEVRFWADLAKTRLLLAQGLQALGRAAEAAEAGRLAVADYDHLIASNPRDYRTNFATLLPGAGDGSMAPAPAGPDDSGFRTREFDAAPKPPDEGPAPGPLSEFRTGPVPPADPFAHVPRLQETLSRGYSNAMLVAQAGMSQVFWAIDAALGRPVAIKQLHPAAHPTAVARFHREAVLTAQLRHPNIVEVYSFGLTDAHHLPFLVMRYYPNRTLQEAIRDFYNREWDPAGFAALVEAVIATCDGLAHAHARGLVHRDPKPANVLFGDPGEIVLADWGLVKDVRNRSLEVTAPSGETIRLENLEPGDTAVGAVVGTPAFMSPEAIRGDLHAISPASDIFSVGAMLFQVLTNGPCRQGANAAETLVAPVRRPRDVRPTVPPELDAICARALAEAPGDRYPTVSMLADDLRGWLARSAGGSLWTRMKRKLTGD